MMSTTTSASAGHDHASDALLCERVAATRARDVARLRFVGRWLRRLLMLGAPFAVAVSMAMPNLPRFQCRTWQREMKGNLKSIYVAEESYRAEFGRYSDDALAIGWSPRPGGKDRYTYVVRVAGSESRPHDPARFRAFAVGHGVVAGDVWTINELNELANVVNVCDR